MAKSWEKVLTTLSNRHLGSINWNNPDVVCTHTYLAVVWCAGGCCVRTFDKVDEEFTSWLNEGEISSVEVYTKDAKKVPAKLSLTLL